MSENVGGFGGRCARKKHRRRLVGRASGIEQDLDLVEPVDDRTKRPAPQDARTEDAFIALDHDVADIGGGGRDRGEAAGLRGLDELANPLAPASRFAPAAAGRGQPGSPVPRRQPLGGPRSRVDPATAYGDSAGAVLSTPVPAVKVPQNA